MVSAVARALNLKRRHAIVFHGQLFHNRDSIKGRHSMRFIVGFFAAAIVIAAGAAGAQGGLQQVGADCESGGR